MDKVRVSPAAGCAVRVCCDSMEGYDWKGRIYTRYRHEPAAFTNAGELIGILEDFCDWIGYPQASMIGRSFQETDDRPGGRREREERQVVVVGIWLSHLHSGQREHGAGHPGGQPQLYPGDGAGGEGERIV